MRAFGMPYHCVVYAVSQVVGPSSVDISNAIERK